MNSFPFNGGALNGSASLASIVHLPPAAVSMVLGVSERTSVFMSGELRSTQTLSGDISRVANLGNAPVSLEWLAQGSLFKHRLIFMEGALTGFSLEPAGTVATVNLGPPGQSEWGMEPSGSMISLVCMIGSDTVSHDLVGDLMATRLLSGEVLQAHTLTGSMRMTGLLQGNTGMVRASTGALSQGLRSSIPLASLASGIATTGSLRRNGRMQGSSTQAWVLAGQVIPVRLLAGSSTMGIQAVADLANNAFGSDLQSHTMTRKKTNREMTR